MKQPATLATDSPATPTAWNPPEQPAGTESYSALDELTDEMVRLVKASDLFDDAHRSGDGMIQAMTVDGVAVSIAVVQTQL